MNEDQINLARRAVACKHWRWVQGMQWTAPHIDGVVWNSGRVEHPPANAFSRIAIPVFSDPATLGCLLHLVREAWGDASIASASLPDGTGYLRSSVRNPLFGQFYPSEAAALVAALEAAP
jgi:hypothetical protein